MKLILALALVLSTAAAAKSSECKESCAAVRGPCAAACQDPNGAGKTKKNAAECMKRMCEVAVQQCEQSCSGGSNGKKR
jgi:hypothetical protein